MVKPYHMHTICFQARVISSDETTILGAAAAAFAAVSQKIVWDSQVYII